MVTAAPDNDVQRHGDDQQPRPTGQPYAGRRPVPQQQHLLVPDDQGRHGIEPQHPAPVLREHGQGEKDRREVDPHGKKKAHDLHRVAQGCGKNRKQVPDEQAEEQLQRQQRRHRQQGRTHSMERGIDQGHQQKQRPEDNAAGQHGPRREEHGRQRILLQGAPRLDQAVHAPGHGVTERHPWQRPHDQERAYGMRGGSVAKPHGEHDIENEVIGRDGQQGLQVRPQDADGRTCVARRHLAPGQHPYQGAGAPDGTPLVPQSLHEENYQRRGAARQATAQALKACASITPAELTRYGAVFTGCGL